MSEQPETLSYQQSPKKFSGFVIASLSLGIIAIPLDIALFTGMIFGILAIVFGVVALGRIRRKSLRGKAMALAGIILGVLSLLLGIGCGIMLFGKPL